jgi:hypothetical protein
LVRLVEAGPDYVGQNPAVLDVLSLARSIEADAKLEVDRLAATVGHRRHGGAAGLPVREP